MPSHPDVVVIGAGAAGLMCALTAGYAGRRVLVLDHASKPGKKILMSGGGRCNFTNLDTAPANFFSANPHFCISALKRYRPEHFLELVERHAIEPVEKAPGQLFCADSSRPILDMLLTECDWAGVAIRLATPIERIERHAEGMRLSTAAGRIECGAVVIATGGLSIPKIGATRFGYDVARQFGLDVTGLRPALVPLTFQANFLERCKALSGLSVDAEVRHGKTSFREGLLFTHRGLSGPSVLQISSYWDEGEGVSIDLAPGIDIAALLTGARAASPKREVLTELAAHLPKRLAANILDELGIGGRLAELSKKGVGAVGDRVNRWQVRPSGTEGYRTAEVTLGGVDVSGLSAQTMEAKAQPGLYFIGEVVDVTGHLGGYNFQWAWSSGFVAGEAA